MSNSFAGLNVAGRLTVVHNGQVYNADSSHINYAKLKEAFNKKDASTFAKLSDIPNSINVMSKGKVSVIGDRVLYNNNDLHNVVVDRLLALLREGYNIEYLVKFLEKLMQNPSKRSVDQLYTFLEKHFLPITEDGDFLAYKVVSSTFKDKHTGTFDNSVGQVLQCERNEVCDNPDIACSVGFHAGSLEYSGPQGSFYSSGDNIIIVRINPADVVSVPTDSNCGKLRTCRYEVISLYTGNLDKQVYAVKDNVYTATDPESYQDKWDDNANYDNERDNFIDEDDEDDDDINDWDTEEENDEENDDENNKAYISPNEMCIDSFYEFEYWPQGDRALAEVRYVQLISIDIDYVTCLCVSPDKSVGSYRNFTKKYMVDVNSYMSF